MSNDKISGVGINIAEKATLQADNFLNFSITVPSYEEQKEIDWKETGWTTKMK